MGLFIVWLSIVYNNLWLLFLQPVWSFLAIAYDIWMEKDSKAFRFNVGCQRTKSVSPSETRSYCFVH